MGGTAEKRRRFQPYVDVYKRQPYSRRILTNIYNFRDLSEMNLEPCAYSMTFNVTGKKLNAILHQRSQDILAANNWNVVQYSVLVLSLIHIWPNGRDIM